MSSPESTKQRAFRIELDHHKRPEPLARAKWWLAVVATAATVVYVGYLYVPGSEGQSHFSPGDVSQVHAALNNRCSECHLNFHAIRGDAWGAGDKDELQLVDVKCQTCHAGPVHHTNISPQSTRQVESCGGCHQEHQGARELLVRMSDQHCTRCHAQPDRVVAQSALSPDVQAVKSFYSSTSDREDAPAWPHPDFRSLAADPGNIEFNHALHMTPGMRQPAAQGQGRALSKYELIQDKDFLARAIPEWKEGTTGDVRLACASCHEPQTSDDRLAFQAGNEKASRLSAHFAPISFERHCQACHQLRIGPGSNDVVPHRLKAKELEQAIYAFLAERSAQPPVSDLKRFEGRLLGKPREDFIAGKLLDESSERLTAIKEHLATATCTKCHAFPLGENAFSSDVAPSSIPPFWFRHARFDHAAHRGIDCLHCHPQAQAESRRSSDVMIVGYQNCVECHRPVSAVRRPDGSDVGQIFHGARSDCAECHTYHGGELTSPDQHPRHGLPRKGSAP